MKVLIIGAGLSGITAARELLRNGIDVEILEARDRVGGRICEGKSLSVPIDLGASWIHGVNENPLTEIALKLNLKLDITNNPNLTGEGSLEIYDENGNQVHLQVQNKMRAHFQELIDMGRQIVEKHPHDMSFEEMLHHSHKSAPSPKQYTAEELHFIEWLKSGMEGWDNSNLADLSAKNHFWEHDAPLYTGGDGFVCDGFFNIVRFMAKDFLNKIRFNQVVLKVEQFADQVCITTNHGKFYGDYAICTLPLGVLKSGAVSFVPSLPDWKQTSIERIGFGLMNKIVLEFPEVFWNCSVEGMGFVSSKFRGEFGFFLSLHHLLNRPVLMCFVAADFAKEVENWTDDQIIQRIMNILTAIYGKERKIPNPTHHAITRWGSDPFARGSYSFMKVHSTPQHLEDLAKPVHRLHFAGEATDKYPGYTHGAFYSAMREVDLIRKRIAAQKHTIPTTSITSRPSLQLVAAPTSRL